LFACIVTKPTLHVWSKGSTNSKNKGLFRASWPQMNRANGTSSDKVRKHGLGDKPAKHMISML